MTLSESGLPIISASGMADAGQKVVAAAKGGENVYLWMGEGANEAEGKLGNGLLMTLISLRMKIEGFSTEAAGLVMSLYFAGQMLASRTIPGVIARVGPVRTFAAAAARFMASSLDVATRSIAVHLERDGDLAGRDRIIRHFGCRN